MIHQPRAATLHSLSQKHPTLFPFASCLTTPSHINDVSGCRPISLTRFERLADRLAVKCSIVTMLVMDWLTLRAETGRYLTQHYLGWPFAAIERMVDLCGNVNPRINCRHV